MAGATPESPGLGCDCSTGTGWGVLGEEGVQVAFKTRPLHWASRAGLTLRPSSRPSCPWAYLSQRQRRFSILGAPILSTSVASLLGELLHEELALRWERLLLDDVCTGGALAWVPGRTPGAGQLVYPVGSTMDTLCILPCWAQARDGQGVVGLEWPEFVNLSLARCPGFQKVSVTPESEPQVLRDPGRIQLRGPVRQVVTRSVQGEGKAVDASLGLLSCC